MTFGALTVLVAVLVAEGELVPGIATENQPDFFFVENRCTAVVTNVRGDAGSLLVRTADPTHYFCVWMDDDLREVECTSYESGKDRNLPHPGTTQFTLTSGASPDEPLRLTATKLLSLHLVADLRTHEFTSARTAISGATVIQKQCAGTFGYKTKDGRAMLPPKASAVKRRAGQ